MAMSPINRCHKFYTPFFLAKQAGLTLIEVLIALAIISIALTAIIKATSENIKATDHLQNKTIAMWVGQQILSEVRAGTLKLPSGDEALKDTSATLGRTWYWQAKQDVTSNRRIYKIEVQVSASPDSEETPLITLESYIYRDE